MLDQPIENISNQPSILLNSSSIPGLNSFSWCFVMKGCRRICFISIRSSPFFFNVLRIKSFASSVTSTHDGKVI